MKNILILGSVPTLILYIKKLKEIDDVNIYTYKSNSEKCKMYEISSIKNINFLNNINVIISLNDIFLKKDLINLLNLKSTKTFIFSNKHILYEISSLILLTKSIKLQSILAQVNCLDSDNSHSKNKITSDILNCGDVILQKCLENNKQSIQCKKFENICLDNIDKFRQKILPDIKNISYKESVFIDFRVINHAEVLIRNAIYKLGYGWCHTIITGNQAYDYYNDLCKKIHPGIKLIKLNVNNFSHNDYNNLLLTKKFWNMFNCEKILIYQSDSFIFKNNINDFLKWDYIGSPFSKCLKIINAEHQVGNGGLSLRSKSKMIEVLDNVNVLENVYSTQVNNYKITKKLDNYPEDIVFSQNIQNLSIGKVADYDAALMFASDQVYNNDSFGMHCMWNGCVDWEKKLKHHLSLKVNPPNIKKHIIQNELIKLNVTNKLLDFVLNGKTFIKLKINPNIYIKNSQLNLKLDDYEPIIGISNMNFEGKNIPKYIYKVFVNDEKSKIPGEIITKAISSWTTAYPDYELIIYDKPAISDFLLKHFGKEFLDIYDKLIPYAFKCDFFRYCLLYKKGGVYSDLKQVLLEKINFENCHFISAYEKHLSWEKIIIGIDYIPIQNCFIACVEEHPYMKAAIDNCIQNIVNNKYNTFCTDITGPVMLGRCIDSIQNNVSLLNHKEKMYYFFEKREKNVTEFYINSTNFINSKALIKHKYDNSGGADWSSTLNISNNYAKLWVDKKVYNNETNINVNNTIWAYDSNKEGLDYLSDMNILHFLKKLNVKIVIVEPNNLKNDIFIRIVNEYRYTCTFVIIDEFNLIINNQYLITHNNIEKLVLLKKVLNYCDNYEIITNNNLLYDMYDKCVSLEDFIKKQNNPYFKSLICKSKFKHDIKPYFIYFPQFHRIIENDINFYEGYDDFKNLCEFNNYNILNKVCETPDLLELGIPDYNLTNTKLLQKQIDLLYENGFPGLAMYYYWFTTNTITNKNTIFENVINDFFSNVNMREQKIFFIWANENWTDSVALSNSNNNHLIKNVYDEISFNKNITNLLSYFKNDAYLKINNKPVLFIYHSWKMTICEIDLFYELLDTRCLAEGYDGVHLVLNSMFNDDDLNIYKNYKKFYLNVNYKNDKTSFKEYSVEKKSYILDYNLYTTSGLHIKQDQINTIFFNFDNHPRFYKPNKMQYATYCINNTELSKYMFASKIADTYSGRIDAIDNILLINAWNEWGEDMVFEPSSELGYYNINLLIKAITE